MLLRLLLAPVLGAIFVVFLPILGWAAVVLACHEWAKARIKG